MTVGIICTVFFALVAVRQTWIALGLVRVNDGCLKLIASHRETNTILITRLQNNRDLRVELVRMVADLHRAVVAGDSAGMLAALQRGNAAIEKSNESKP